MKQLKKGLILHLLKLLFLPILLCYWFLTYHSKQALTKIYRSNLIFIMAQVHVKSLHLKIILAVQLSLNFIPNILQHSIFRNPIKFKGIYICTLPLLIVKSKIKIIQLEPNNPVDLMIILLSWRKKLSPFFKNNNYHCSCFFEDFLGLRWILLILTHWVVPTVMLSKQILIWMLLQIQHKRYIINMLQLI